MAAPVPIIAVDGGASPEVLGPNALLAAPENPIDLSRYMLHLYETSAENREHYARANKLRMENVFSKRNLSKSLYNAFSTETSKTDGKDNAM